MKRRVMWMAARRWVCSVPRYRVLAVDGRMHWMFMGWREYVAVLN